MLLRVRNRSTLYSFHGIGWQKGSGEKDPPLLFFVVFYSEKYLIWKFLMEPGPGPFNFADFYVSGAAGLPNATP